MLINFSICQDKNSNQLDPIIKSLIIPGWGQKSLSFSKRARYYNYVESGLILTILGTTTYSNILKKNYISFASNHAALSSSGKNHKYWVDIGNYDSINDYNNEHLRNREVDDLYPEDKKWSWDWDFDSNRKTFEKSRILSDQMKLAATFGFGALIMNHVISSIDAMYLKRLSIKDKAYMEPYFNVQNGMIGYSIIFSI